MADDDIRRVLHADLDGAGQRKQTNINDDQIPASHPTTFDPTWDCGALANAVCDVLVSQGKIKEKPAFIRTDRQAKITEVT